MIHRTFAAVLLLLAALGVATAQPLDGLVQEDPARVKITALIQESATLALPARVERALMLTLHAAEKALHEEQNENAAVLLRTFAFEVRGITRAKRLPAETADALIARAEDAIHTCRRRAGSRLNVQ